MTYERKLKIVKIIIMLIIAAGGAWLVVLHSNSSLALGIFLLLWANNIERSIFKKEV